MSFPGKSESKVSEKSLVPKVNNLSRDNMPLYDKAPEKSEKKTNSLLRPSNMPLYDKAPEKSEDESKPSEVAKKALENRRISAAPQTSRKTFSNRSTERPSLKVNQRKRQGSDVEKRTVDPINPSDILEAPGKLFYGDGVLNPENWWLVGDTEEDKARKAEQSGYRAENPMDEGAMDDIVTGSEYLDRYNQYYEDNGGIDDSYEGAWSSFLDNLASRQVTQGMNRNGTATLQVSADMAKSMPGIVKKIADESIDDGTNRRENRKAMMISGEEYIRQRQAGFPGRPIDQINPNAAYNKLEEMDNWNYVPYIENEEQRHLWDFQRAGNDMSNFFKELADVRDDWTDGTLDYNGQKISKKQLDRRLSDYITEAYNRIGSLEQGSEEYDDVFVETSDRSDPRVQDFAVPMKHVYTFGSGSDVEEVSDKGIAHVQETGNGDEIAVWFGDDSDNAWIFDDIDDLNENLVVDVVPTDEEDSGIDTYANIEPLSYMQYDGTEVSIPYYDAIDIGNGKYNVDYGPLNIGKPARDVKNLTEWDFGEWTPKVIDMMTGSSPLWNPKTAWPMAFGNMVTSSQGIDPQSYDQSTGEYRRMADDITADQLAAGTALSMLMPLTEKIAGNLGRGGLTKPLNKIVSRAGLSPLMNYPINAVAGEGIEEVIAGSWEEAQSMGVDEMFGNPVLDEDGNPVFDNSGHAVKDPDTPFMDRLANYASTIPENFTAGAVLGSTMAVPQIVRDKVGNTGYVGQHNEQKRVRAAEKEAGLPRYRMVKRGNKEFVITPEVLEEHRRD